MKSRPFTILAQLVLFALIGCTRDTPKPAPAVVESNQPVAKEPAPPPALEPSSQGDKLIIKKLVQSGFIATNVATGKRLIVDPGKYIDELTGKTSEPKDWPNLSIIIITHSHSDHFDLALLKVILASNPEAVIITTNELVATLKKENISAKSFGPGQIHEQYGFTITGIPAKHVIAETTVIETFGITIKAVNRLVYATSDTLYLDPSTLNIGEKVDLLMIPCTGRGVTMTEDEAFNFTTKLAPRKVLPVHYDSPKDQGRINPDTFLKRFSGSSIEAIYLGFGQDLIL